MKEGTDELTDRKKHIRFMKFENENLVLYVVESLKDIGKNIASYLLSFVTSRCVFHDSESSKMFIWEDVLEPDDVGKAEVDNRRPIG